MEKAVGLLCPTGGLWPLVTVDRPIIWNFSFYKNCDKNTTLPLFWYQLTWIFIAESLIILSHWVKKTKEDYGKFLALNSMKLGLKVLRLEKSLNSIFGQYGGNGAHLQIILLY